MRLKALKELGIKEVPTKILPTETSVEKLKAYTIKDNVSFGDHDWEVLSNEWDSEQLEDWGLDVWTPEDIDLDEFFNEPENDGSSKKGKIVLEYSEDEYDKVVAAFDKINGSKEQIVWKFLNLDEE
jgi:hypothetical protein